MALPQQRTKSRRRYDPAQEPLPVLFSPPSISVPVPGLTLLTWPDPVIIRGIPPVANQIGELPLGITIVDDNQISLVWATAPSPGDVLTFPAWSPAIRGANGEWGSGGTVLIGGGSGGALPSLSYVTQVGHTLTSSAFWNLAVPWTADSALALLIDGQPGTALSQLSPTVIEVVYASPPLAGSVWSVGIWSEGAYASADNRWLAPGTGRVD